jgi:hypothetical protein
VGRAPGPLLLPPSCGPACCRRRWHRCRGHCCQPPGGGGPPRGLLRGWGGRGGVCACSAYHRRCTRWVWLGARGATGGTLQARRHAGEGGGQAAVRTQQHIQGRQASRQHAGLKQGPLQASICALQYRYTQVACASRAFNHQAHAASNMVVSIQGQQTGRTGCSTHPPRFTGHSPITPQWSQGPPPLWWNTRG